MIVFKEESAKIVGAIFEVHKRLGVGLLEKVYQEALAIELKHRNIPFEREKRFDIFYRDQKLDAQYIADFVCYDKITNSSWVSCATSMSSIWNLSGFSIQTLCSF